MTVTSRAHIGTLLFMKPIYVSLCLPGSNVLVYCAALVDVCEGDGLLQPPGDLFKPHGLCSEALSWIYSSWIGFVIDLAGSNF